MKKDCIEEMGSVPVFVLIGFLLCIICILLFPIGFGDISGTYIVSKDIINKINKIDGMLEANRAYMKVLEFEITRNKYIIKTQDERLDILEFAAENQIKNLNYKRQGKSNPD